MKLISISIRKLYGCYDYSVNFNSDVTIIYGLNGCGKTTILNITEAIITGQLFKLFNFNFKSIKLKYAKDADLNSVNTIEINSNDNKLNVLFNQKLHTIELIDVVVTSRHIREISHNYYSHYDFLWEIKETFNYVYLPLNRSYIPYNEMDNIYSTPRFRKRFFKEEDSYIDSDSNDGAMLKIESLIYQNHSRVSSAINRINDRFRNNILKPQIEISDSYEFSNYLLEIREYTVPFLEKTKTEYIRILKELNIIDKKDEEKYIQFFSKFLGEFSYFMDNKDDDSISLGFILKFQEIARIQKTIEIAEKMEQRKAAVMKPMETFLNTMNSFIGHGEDEKKLYIDNDGHIYFKTKYSDDQVSIQHLSSGEKQLITFFANLIFMVKDKSSGIFVVDEPELSLHLSWQKIFIDKILEINSNTQLVFATHAPEIIGCRRDKMVKLDKKYTKVE